MLPVMSSSRAAAFASNVAGDAPVVRADPVAAPARRLAAARSRTSARRARARPARARRRRRGRRETSAARRLSFLRRRTPAVRGRRRRATPSICARSSACASSDLVRRRTQLQLPSRSTRTFAWASTRRPSTPTRTSSAAMTRNATSSFVRRSQAYARPHRTRRFVIRAERRRARTGGPRCDALGCAISSPGYGLSTAGVAAEFVSSHLPLIFCTWWCTADEAHHLLRLRIDVVALEVERRPCPRSRSTLILYEGVSDSQ